jgi:hypothetical protein
MLFGIAIDSYFKYMGLIFLCTSIYCWRKSIFCFWKRFGRCVQHCSRPLNISAKPKRRSHLPVHLRFRCPIKTQRANRAEVTPELGFKFSAGSHPSPDHSSFYGEPGLLTYLRGSDAFKTQRSNKAEVTSELRINVSANCSDVARFLVSPSRSTKDRMAGCLESKCPKPVMPTFPIFCLLSTVLSCWLSLALAIAVDHGHSHSHKVLSSRAMAQCLISRSSKQTFKNNRRSCD